MVKPIARRIMENIRKLASGRGIGLEVRKTDLNQLLSLVYKIPIDLSLEEQLRLVEVSCNEEGQSVFVEKEKTEVKPPADHGAIEDNPTFYLYRDHGSDNQR